MYSFRILSILVTPNENRNIFNSATSIFASCIFVSATVCVRPPSPPVQQCWSHCHPVHLPFHSSWYSPIADHSWHSSPTIPSCLYSLLHFSSAFSITLYSWAQVFEILFSLPLTCLSFTHMYYVFLLLTFIPLLSKAYLQLSSFSSTRSLLSLQITMSSANIMVHGASSLISSVILSITIANKQVFKFI